MVAGQSRSIGNSPRAAIRKISNRAAIEKFKTLLGTLSSIATFVSSGAWTCLRSQRRQFCNYRRFPHSPAHRGCMYHHVKKLMYTVRVDEPDPRSATCCWSSSAAPTANSRRRCSTPSRASIATTPARKDLLMDIGTEELSHLEIVGTLARMHLKPLKSVREAAEADPLIAIAGGGGVNLFNSMGNAWTADYLKITGELDVDLRSNIAAEARAKIVYERLINFCRRRRHQGRAAVSDDARDHAHAGVHRWRWKAWASRRSASARSRRRRSSSTSTSTIRPAKAITAKSTRAARGMKARPWEFVEAPAFQDLQTAPSPMARPSMRKLRPVEIGADRGTAGRSTARHSARREAAVEGAAEDGQGGAIDPAAAPAGDPSRGDRGAGRAAERKPPDSGRAGARQSLAREWQAWSRKARR